MSLPRTKRRLNLETVRVVRREGSPHLSDVIVDGHPAGIVEALNGAAFAIPLTARGNIQAPPQEFRGKGAVGNAVLHIVRLWEKGPASRVANRAKREHRDVVTGGQRRPGTAGAVPSGRYVLRVRPAPGEPFEQVYVDREDLDPSRDILGVDPGLLRQHYPREARQAARARATAERERAARLKRMAKGRVKGVRVTFDTAAKGAEEIYQHNIGFYQPIVEVADPIDDLDRWFDTNEVKIGKRWRPLKETKRGRELYQLHQDFSPRAVKAALAYILGRAGGKRWDRVDWRAIEEYNDALRSAYRRQEEGGRGFAGGWNPTFELPLPARGLPTEAQALEAAPQLQEQYRWLEAREELEAVADRLASAYRKNRKHIQDKRARKAIRERIKDIQAWAEDPAMVPPWACVTRGVYCDFPALWQEVARVDMADETPYEPDWALGLSETEAEDLGLPPAPGRRGAPEPSPLDLPWERAANPQLQRLRNRLLRGT